MKQKIGLIQIDGKIPNLALMKLSTWHKGQGDEIYLMRDKIVAQRLINFDKVYVSCVFEENKEIAIKVSQQFKNVEIGGIGVNNVRLPEEVEHLMPDYDLYGCDYSMGFTTRGCIRKCSFCKVPQHEGNIRVNCDINEFWNKRHKVLVLLDNNILAVPNHFKKIANQIKENDLKVDFNQGLDHRLLNKDIVEILFSLKHKMEIRFAFDDIRYMKTVLRALKLMKEQGLKNWKTRWYIYISEEDDFESVYMRMSLLRSFKQLVYVMRDKKVYHKKEFVALAKYGNLMGAFKYEWKELNGKSDCLKPYRNVYAEYSDVIDKCDKKCVKLNNDFALEQQSAPKEDSSGN